MKLSSRFRRIGKSEGIVLRRRFSLSFSVPISHNFIFPSKRLEIKSVYMELPGRRCNFLLFIAIIQILYGTMDTYVDCIIWYCPSGLTLVDKYPYRPVCVPNKVTEKPGQFAGGAIVDAPCPSGTQADENGNCRQRLRPAQPQQGSGKGDGYPSILAAPCPGGTRMNEYGNCRQILW